MKSAMARLDALLEEVGLASRLRDLDVPEQELHRLWEEGLDTSRAGNNVVPLDAEDVKRLVVERY